jgi:hypothetical protein
MGFAKEDWTKQVELGYGVVPDKYVRADCFDNSMIGDFIVENADNNGCNYTYQIMITNKY